MTQVALKYRTMTEIIADELRVKILNGDLIPGQRLVTADIADEMGVSRMPVRDALRYIESTGLVETIPHRGTIVKDLSEDEIVELYQMRAVLEGLAARLASKRVNEVQLKHLDSIISKHDLKAMQNECYDEFTKLNRNFHAIIWAAAGSRRLENLLANLYDACSQYRNLSMLVPGRPDSIYKEHSAISEAIKCRNCDEAEHLARTHYENTSLALIAAIDNRKKHADENNIHSDEKQPGNHLAQTRKHGALARQG